jgi:hypothetical protein
MPDWAGVEQLILFGVLVLSTALAKIDSKLALLPVLGLIYHWFGEDLIGIRTLAGGVNGISVTVPARTPNVTTALAQERIAEAAAWTVVGAGGGDLIATVIATDAETVAAQIEVLHRRILSQPAGSDDAAATVALFGAILSSTGDAEAAWAGVISALLRDPEFLFF